MPDHRTDDVRTLLSDIAQACRVKADEAHDSASEASAGGAMRLFHYHEGRNNAFGELAQALETVVSTKLQNRRVKR